MIFKYDKSEKVTPDGYLTPVYFNKQVLNRYLYDSRFYCDFYSETYGSLGSKDFDIPFGINKNGSLLLWLGDIIERLPQKEQIYLLVENKDPEGEVASEFYDAQINTVFTDPPLGIKTLNQIAKLNSAFEDKYAIFLYKNRSIEERIDDTRKYKRILMNDMGDFKWMVTELNIIINESTNNDALRKFLGDHGIEYKEDSKGNKLLEKIYVSILGDDENAIAPFFYLYDLRLWATHKGKNHLLPEVISKLGLLNDVGYKEILDALLLSILESSKILKKKIVTQNT